MTIDINHIATSLMFLPPPEGNHLPILYVGWSLNYELFFYIILALCLFFKNRAFYLTFIIVTILGAIGHKTGYYPIDYYLYDGLIEFSAGLIIGHLIKNGITVPRETSFALIIASLLIFTINSSYPTITKSIYWGVPSVMLVIGMLSFEKTWIVNNKLILMIGASSYSIYLFHPFIIWIIEWGMDNQKNYLLPLPAIILSTILGYLFFRFLEQPLASIGRSRKLAFS